jgi:hypothetical protein
MYSTAKTNAGGSSTQHFDDIIRYVTDVKPAAGAAPAVTVSGGATSFTLLGIDKCPDGYDIALAGHVVKFTNHPTPVDCIGFKQAPGSVNTGKGPSLGLAITSHSSFPVQATELACVVCVTSLSSP